MAIPRRTVLKTAVATAGWSVVPGWLRAAGKHVPDPGPPALRPPAADGKRPPNILMFVADDHWKCDSGAYGATVVRTPTIDAFAREGMRFDNVMTPTTVCGPSRACLYTGLYPYRHGAYHQHSTVRDGVKSLPTYLRSLGYRCAITGKTDIRPPGAFPFEYYKDEGEVENAKQFLFGVGQQPFCLVVASHWPHRPFASKAGPIKYDPAKVVVPPSLVDTPETREDLANNYGAVTALDARFAEVLASLSEHGHADNTVVIYTADHGQSYPFSKWTLYKAGMNNPFIVRWPGQVAPGTSSDALVSFVDVVPTLIDIAGGKSEATLDGTSFRDVLTGKAKDHQECVFGAYTHIGVASATSDYPIRAASSKTHHYIRNIAPDKTFTNNLTASGEDARFWPSWQKRAQTDAFAAERVKLYQHRSAEELYDVKADPWMLKNLAADSQSQPVLIAMRGKTDAWLKQQGDPTKFEEAMEPRERKKRGEALPAEKAED